jgi:hypothetical protein
MRKRVTGARWRVNYKRGGFLETVVFAMRREVAGGEENIGACGRANNHNGNNTANKAASGQSAVEIFRRGLMMLHEKS